MNQIEEKEFRDAIIGTKKDAKLIAAARNDRTNAISALYSEFAKLPVERQRDIIISISTDYFVAAQWKIVFPLNNFAAAILPDAVRVAGKALFFSREEANVRETVRAVRIYEETAFLKPVCAVLADAAEIAGERLSEVAEIITSPGIFGMVKSLDSSLQASEKIVSVIGKTATYTKDLEATQMTAKFLFARRYSPIVVELASMLENAVFLARDRKSIKEILAGFTSGGIDVVLQRVSDRKEILSGICDIAWKTKDARTIRNYLNAYLN